MSATALLWSGSPIMLGRPSSPLNPNYASSSIPSSSPPASSPTPHHRALPSLGHSLGSPSLKHRHSSSPALRYTRPKTSRSPTFPLPPAAAGPSTPRTARTAQNPFAEAATPVESAMWKERFVRRVKDRERRKKAREDDLNRRRSASAANSDEAMDEELADRQAEEDDEEIFRRLMVLQKRRANHQSLVSYEVETGGSDPLLPEFWEDELYQLENEERDVSTWMDPPPRSDSMDITPTRARPNPHRRSTMDEEEEWARQAAEAEEAEREMEEADVAQKVEEAYGLAVPTKGSEVDMDWQDFDAMDIE